MGTITTQSKYYSAIANAIRENKETEETFTPAQMADEINNACTIQYANGLQAGHRIERGVFTMEKDSSSLTLNIPAGAKMIEIVPQGTPAAGTSSRIPVHYLFAAERFQTNNIIYPGYGVLVQYSYSGLRTSFYQYDSTDGITVILDKVLVFEAGMTYSWTAHYWQE